MTKLHELPVDHPLRCKPLAEIGAEVRNLHSTQWRKVEPRWGIARNRYNDLRGPWIEHNEFRAESQ